MSHARLLWLWPLTASALLLLAASGRAAELPEAGGEEPALPVGAMFKPQLLDKQELADMDCHLRNVDLCLAGLLATGAKPLPASQAELEARCDQLKVTAACMNEYNRRCATLRVFSALSPFGSMSGLVTAGSGSAGPQQMLGQLLSSQQQMQQSLAAETGNGSAFESARLGSSSQLSGELGRVADLASMCEPGARFNATLRRQVFGASSCLNKRLPHLKPCLEDLKTALQLFYEPRRSLPLKPSCCAIRRFSDCAAAALDDFCGLRSFEQLLEGLGAGAQGSSASMLRLVERVCKQGARTSGDWAAQCADVLPPAGVRVPPARGSRASKLVRALELVQVAGPEVAGF